MNRLLICTFACAAALLNPVVAQAETPDLVGLWECGGTDTVFRQGQWATTKNTVIEITEQRGALFIGFNRWELPSDSDASGHYDGKLTPGASVTFLGAVDTSDNSLTMVSHSDTHNYKGELVDDNTLRLIMSESGEHAWIAINTCRRNPG